MLGQFHHLGDHGLHDRHVSIERATHKPCQQGNPITLGQTKNQTREGHAHKSQQNNRLSPDAVRQNTPSHRGQGLGDSVRRDEQARVE